MKTLVHCEFLHLQHLVSEWLNDRSGQEPDASPARPSIAKQLEPLEVSTAVQPPPGPSEPEADFVKCVPSPHAGALSHLRRSSVSSGNAQNSARAINSIPYEQRDTSMGSAKKVSSRIPHFYCGARIPN